MKIAVTLSLLGLILLGMMQANPNTSMVTLEAKTEYFTTSIFDTELEVAKRATTNSSEGEYIVSMFEVATK